MSDGKLPKVGWRKIVKALGKREFYVTHQRGSHIYLTDKQKQRPEAQSRDDRDTPIHHRAVGALRDEFISLLD